MENKKILQTRQKLREKKEMERKNKKKLKSYELGFNQIFKPLLFFVISVILELLSFALFKFKTTSGATQICPTYILFDIGFWLVICGFILCTHKNWISNLIFYFVLLLEATLFVTNIILKEDFGYLFSFDMFRLIPEMLESIDLSFINYKLIIIALIGIAVVIAIPLIFDKLLKNKKIKIKKISKPIFCLLFFLVSATVGSGCFAAQTALLKTSATNKEISDDKYLYENLQINDQAYQKFGSCGFYFQSVLNLIFKNHSISKSDQEKTLELYKNSISTNNSGELENDNLIVIMLESVEWFAIDPYNTPNLWNLKNSEAVVFENYHSNNKTNVSEDLCILGYMPTENTFMATTTNSYSTKYSLPNLFKNQGYTTSFLHNWKINFYNRNITNRQLGFENIYSLENFESENKSTQFNYYNLESDFIDQFINQLAPTNKKFMSFYTTVSSHGTYTIQNSRFEKHFETYGANLSNLKAWFEEEDYNFPQDEKYQAILKEYKSAIMDTDEMIGKLFNHLNDTGLINNTTVVLYADHNAYYQDLTNEIKKTNKNDYSDQYSYNVPLMIYSNKLTHSINNTYCSTYDLYPTIASLFNLPYNTINAQGKNILSSDISNTVYMSLLTGFYSEKCYSKNMLYINKYEGSTDADVENFKKNVSELLRKQKILMTIYRSNFKY